MSLIGMSDSWPDEITARIAGAIKKLRGDRSGQWLSDRTADLGHRVSRSTISEIETGRRKSITVADLIILAAALDTVPVALVYPGPYDEDVRALPAVEVPQIWAVRWFSGELRDLSEVPFDEKGHLVQIPHPAAYGANVQRLQYARAAAEAYDKKTALLHCGHCREVIKPNQTGGWYHVETEQHRSDQRCFLYANPADEPCQACGGRGSWETECCNGSGGCSCRGGLIDMGACHSCGGSGTVPAGQQSPAANANFILNNHIAYPGGGPRGGW